MSFERLWRAYGAFLYGCGLIAGFITFSMMVLVVINAISRYVFNSPINGGFEITQSMLTILVFLSLALAQFHDAHIRVVLLTQRLPSPIQHQVRIFALLVGAAFFVWCSFATWGFAMESYLTGEREWGALRYHLYPVKFVVFFGLLLLSIQFLLGAIREIKTSPNLTEESAK